MGNSRLLELQNPSKMQGAKRTTDYSQYSDKDLLVLCQKYGTQTILWRQRFIGLLPEVNRRRLYEKKRFSSIIEFGKRMAGLSEAQIRLAINLEKKFEDKPELHSALIDGKISVNKLVRVAAIATAENEGELAKYAKVLSKSSLDVLVKDIRRNEVELLERDNKNGSLSSDELRNGNGLFEPQIDIKSLPGQKFSLNAEVIEKLNALHTKGIDVNETILKMLEKREEGITINKDVQSEKILEKEARRKEDGKAPNRNVSVITKRILKEEYGTKCCVGGCKKESAQIHHTVPFSIGKSNSPNLLKPLCREHHDILHTVNSNYVRKKWQ